MQEMKAYIGSDDTIEAAQKARGFKTYRDLYNKKISEAEIAGRGLRDLQKEVKAKHEPNVKQLAMFQDLKKLLALKMAHNTKVLSGEAKEVKTAKVSLYDPLFISPMCSDGSLLGDPGPTRTLNVSIIDALNIMIGSRMTMCAFAYLLPAQNLSAIFMSFPYLLKKRERQLHDNSVQHLFQSTSTISITKTLL